MSQKAVWRDDMPGTPMLPLSRAVFIDMDGTLVTHAPHNVDPARLQFTPHAPEGLTLLARAGYRLIVVTHQPGLALGLFDRAALLQLHTGLAARAKAEGVLLDDFFACPHASTVTPAGEAAGTRCLCRKPAPGLLRQAAGKHRLDLSESWVVGSLLDDVEAGQRAGSRTLLLDLGRETAWRMSPLRTPHARATDLRDAAQLILALDAERAHEATLARPAAALPETARADQPPASWHARLRAAASRWMPASRPASHGLAAVDGAPNCAELR